MPSPRWLYWAAMPKGKLNIVYRLLIAASAVLLVIPTGYMDAVGLLLAAATLGYILLSRKRRASKAA